MVIVLVIIGMSSLWWWQNNQHNNLTSSSERSSLITEQTNPQSASADPILDQLPTVSDLTVGNEVSAVEQAEEEESPRQR
ncbi:hypothetical protein ACT691_19805 [Vibrio metschnikovii]